MLSIETKAYKLQSKKIKVKSIRTVNLMDRNELSLTQYEIFL
jgi:hypothetical protein